MHPLQPGDHTAFRESFRGCVWTVRPVTVVENSAELRAFYMMPGTVCMHPVAMDGSAVSMFLPDEWKLIERAWKYGGALYLSPPGAWWSLMGVFDDANNQIERWHLNFQTPYERTAFGYKYLDQELDILLTPHDDTWQWRDQDKFADAIARGVISEENGEHVQSLADEMMSDLRAGSTKDSKVLWLLEEWRTWTPPSGWTQLPILPERWDDLSE